LTKCQMANEMGIRVNLVEMGFLSNWNDEANLKRDSYRKDLSRRLTRAILAYLGEYGPKI